MRRWVQSVPKLGLRRAAGPGEEAFPPLRRGGPPESQPAAPVSDPCDFLTYIFHGLALVHGTTQELCRSTATVWFVLPSSPSRFI